MRVLFVSSGNSVYGISPITKGQGDSLIKRGIDLEYFLIRGKGVSGYLKSIAPLRKRLKEHRYDIVHAHYGLCGVIAGLARRREKLVVSFMGDDLIGEKDDKGNNTFIGNLYVSIDKWFARHRFNTCIVKSDEMAGILKKAGVEPFVLPNGVDFSIFFPVEMNKAREELGLDPDQKIVLFVSRTSRPEKNFALAGEAVDLLKDSNVRLIDVYGIPQEKLNLYYSAADTLILTSFHEGSPNAVKEAMACNCPIVATPVGDVKKVTGRTEGCFITSYDAGETADKIRKALEFGKRTTGRSDIAHLDSRKTAERLEDIYRKTIEQ